MRYYLFIFSIIILVSACHSDKQKRQVSNNKIISLIPQNSSYTFIVNKNKSWKNQKLSLIDYYLTSDDINFITTQGFQTPFLINIFQKDKKLKSFVSIGKSKNFDSIFNEKEGNYNQVDIYKNRINNKNYFGFAKNGFVYISNHKTSLENIIRAENDKTIDSSFINIEKLIDSNSDLNLICFNKNISNDVFNSSLLKQNNSEISEIECYDIVDSEKDTYTGISFDSEEKLPKIFDKVDGLDNGVFDIIPVSFTTISRCSTDDLKTFTKNLEEYFGNSFKNNPKISNKLKGLESITFLKENNNYIAYYQLDDLENFLSFYTKTDDFLSYPIYEINDDINSVFDVLISDFTPKYFTIYNDFIVLSETKSYLKKIINDIENARVLSKQKDFTELSKQIPEKRHLSNLNKINSKFIYKSYTKENKHTFVSLIIEKTHKTHSNEIEQLLSYELNDTPIIKPQLVYNHKNKTFRIIYQNENNELKYIDLSGKILWKKNFNEKIIGKIIPIDIYRNHKIQYTFVTKEKWYVIDRYGRNVEGFPVKLNNITKGISVFDYDKNRKYRFGITQGKKFTLFDSKGKKVKGFKVKTKSEISFSPQHFRIKNKDFIEIQEESGKLNLLDRRGNTRIKISEEFDNLKQDWSALKTKFINIDNDNNLIAIDLKGKIKKAKILDGDSIKFETKYNHFVAVSDGKLLIDNKIHSIDLGNYLKPFIYKTKKKNIYYFVSDTEHHKIIAYNSKGKKLKHFPIVGEQILDVKDLKSRLYILVYDNDHNLMIYRF